MSKPDKIERDDAGSKSALPAHAGTQRQREARVSYSNPRTETPSYRTAVDQNRLSAGAGIFDPYPQSTVERVHTASETGRRRTIERISPNELTRIDPAEMCYALEAATTIRPGNAGFLCEGAVRLSRLDF
jgi:hypothetical protein